MEADEKHITPTEMLGDSIGERCDGLIIPSQIELVALRGVLEEEPIVEVFVQIIGQGVCVLRVEDRSRVPGPEPGCARGVRKMHAEIEFFLLRVLPLHGFGILLRNNNTTMN